MYTVQGILFFIKRLTSLCLQSLHHHFINWTKPDTATSLMVGTLTDLARNKFELVAENALLRKPLIILLYWLLGSSVQKIWPSRRKRTPFPACKHRPVGVESDVVNSILMPG